MSMYISLPRLEQDLAILTTDIGVSPSLYLEVASFLQHILTTQQQ
jgi:hypothetical protein